MPSPSALCWPGTAPGGWHRYEWLLHNESWPQAHASKPSAHANTSSRCTALTRIVHANVSKCGPKRASPVPGAGTTNLPSCADRDVELLKSPLLANASLLMLGDSTAAQLLLHACEAYSVRPKSFIPVDQSTARALNFSVRKYGHRLRSLDNHACKLPGNFVLGSFSHYGATGPPYWVFAYPLAPWQDGPAALVARHRPESDWLAVPEAAAQPRA